MRLVSVLNTGFLITGVLSSAVCLRAQGQTKLDQTKQDQSSQEQNTKEFPGKGMPPRAAASEYQSQGKAGTVTIGAEFAGHSVTTPEHTYSSEDYIVVEAGFFGPPGAQITLARSDFSLRINGKKVASPSEPYELVFHSLKDPEWIPPETEDSKAASKTSLSTNGSGGANGAPPPLPPKMPFPLRRAMEQHVQKAAMQEGDRPLPQAGLLFFRFGGKADGIKSLELTYSGAAGSATLTLEP
jgi:hypothetical protein